MQLVWLSMKALEGLLLMCQMPIKALRLSQLSLLVHLL